MSSDEARALIQRAADLGFWALCTKYAQIGPGAGTIVTTISIAGHVRRVEDTGEAAPGWLRAVDLDVDREADTHRWRHGTPERELFGADHLAVDTMSPKAGVTRLMRVAASRRGTGELAEMLADTSLDRNATDSSGWNALMYAAQAGTTTAVRMLLDARADPARKSNAAETVLAAAVSSNDDPAGKIRILTAAGVDVNAADLRGVTPLILAAKRPEVPGVIAALIQAGADPTKRDVQGRTALSYLEEADAGDTNHGRYRSARQLLARGK
ncbi:hypothetical protein GRAN_3410 [Granulicella sibirica]|uniref:Uncharacterized protein n=2 Tax=Granulicella sibirica TaxID=2479048 RepID=A0A4Q0SZ42_9BACT|nr:hypothetical protein GRAN_3410 [Granulicella sibirica]